MVAKALADAGKKTKIGLIVDPAFPALKASQTGAKDAVGKYGAGSTVSVVPVSIDHDHGQDPGPGQLLALFALR